MANPFEDQTSTYYALINNEGQYSLWPKAVDVPAGWTIAFGPNDKVNCLDFIETSWTDMRPRALSKAMSS